MSSDRRMGNELPDSQLEAVPKSGKENELGAAACSSGAHKRNDPQPLDGQQAEKGEAGGCAKRHDTVMEEMQYESSCFGCKSSLSKSRELISISGQAHRWHPECFACAACAQRLDQCHSCHLLDGKVLCRDDYAKLKRAHQGRQAKRCTRCRWPIGASDWVRRAADHVYHLACFSCDICFRQLNTGDQFFLDARNTEQTVKLLCRIHFSPEDRLDWRARRSHMCSSAMRAPLGIGNPESAASSLFAKSAPRYMIHEERASASSIAQHSSPQLSGATNELAAMAGMSSALVGRTSQSKLSSRGMLMIDASAETGAAGRTATNNSSPISATNAMGINFESEYLRIQLSNQMNHNSSASSNSSLSSGSSTPTHSSIQLNSSLILSLNTSGAAADAAVHHATDATANANQSCLSDSSVSSAKSKRVRTTFTDDQLSILQTHFQIDSNPDGQDLERIATITGLSKRVTQVWFQNSRARQKKYLVKKSNYS